jgi:chromosomal replication initiation ATPase DnaA
MISPEQSEYQHIAPAFRDVMSKSDETRLNFIEESRWIGYRAANNILSHLSAMMNLPKRPRMPNLLLVGDSHNGKTHILNHFKKLYGQAYVNDNNEPVIPVMIVQAPPGPVEKDLMIQILDKFSSPYRYSDPVVKLRHQAIHMMRHCNVKILIIDEVHSMLSGSGMSQRQVMTSIKYLCNELMIPIVCAGTRSAARIVSQDPQHASRFEAITLDKWNLDEDFRLLVSSFEQVLPLKQRSNLRSKELLIELHAQSRGNIGDLHALLRDCARHAIRSGSERIDLETIQMYALERTDKGLKTRRA